ncbi:MAG TPA: hypothetical protein VFV58_39380 [Blastocatellia bacterium]|jgi:hypothetical protein|nr:hypothetical protein [Blastocatellia bacterium]
MKAQVKSIRNIARVLILLIWELRRNLEWINIRASFKTPLDRNLNKLTVTVEYGFSDEGKEDLHFRLPIDIRNHAVHMAVNEVFGMVQMTFMSAYADSRPRSSYKELAKGPSKNPLETLAKGGMRKKS